MGFFCPLILLYITLFLLYMEELNGVDALRIAKEISQVPDMTFTIAFYPYSRAKGEASAKLTVKQGCTARKQLPEDKFGIDSENFFLFTDNKGNPKACYKILIRYMGFPQDNFKLRKTKMI